MKRTLALVLALALLSGLGAAMAETYELSYGATVEVRKDENGNTVDLGGIDVIIGDWWSGDPAAPATAAEEATEEYRQWIQDTYNFTIRQVAVSGWADNPDFFTNYVTTGGPENYVFVMRPEVLATPMVNGLLYDLATLEALDFSEPKWNRAVMEVMSKGDSIYGMRPIASEPRDGIYFNKRLLEEAGIDPDSLYDMQANGTWTWEAYEELAKKLTRDTNNDGVIDIYATASQQGGVYNVALASNGAAFVKQDENGKYYDATGEDAFLEAANWVVHMSRTYEMPQPEGSNWDWTFAAFINGDVAMTVHQDYFKSTLASSMTDPYGFVMFPRGPRGETYKNVYSDNTYVLPANSDEDRAEKIATAFDLYTDPTPGY
ncbi:MAG TPA: extracellular solute-binding protein, partial [Candidatus Limnocylindria bacterium]|nr:extracellular solute-binding protein [Candidatus Limnocylindria bacterium]